MHPIVFALLASSALAAAEPAATSNSPAAISPAPASPFTAESAQAYLRRFVAERLDGDALRLADFDVSTLQHDKVFGNKDERMFDCDDSELSRAVFTVLWGDVLPELTGNLGRGCKWRGDTMNSFHTVFGKPTTNGTFRGIAKFKAEEELLERARQFHRTYHTIGNFTPLPNLALARKPSCEGGRQQFITLNMFRAGIWKDFFDRFAAALRTQLMGAGEPDGEFEELLRLNGFFFDSRRSETAFTTFARDSLWDDYLDENGKPKTLFPISWWWNPKLTHEEYVAAAKGYIDAAEPIIKRRGARIAAAVKSKLGL